MKKALIVLAIMFAFVVSVTVAQEKAVEKKVTKTSKVTVAKAEKKDACADCKDKEACAAAKKDTKKETVKTDAVKKDAQMKEVKKGGPKEEKSCCEKK